MAKSTLATVILPSPHYSSRCGRRVDRITIHHAAGIASARTLGLLFQNPARGGSANYGIGNDGEIGCYVDEKYRAWTSGSDENDRRAVTSSSRSSRRTRSANGAPERRAGSPRSTSPAPALARSA